MTKRQNKMSDCEQIKRIKYPGDHKPYFDGVCYLKHKDVICNDKNYGLVPSDECDWYTTLTYIGNDQHHLIIDPLQKLISKEINGKTKIQCRNLSSEEYKEEYKKFRSNPSFSATGPKYGPHKTIKFRATKGEYQGHDIEVKMILERPPVGDTEGGGGGGGRGPGDNGDIWHEDKFHLFQDHEELDGIYGWVKYYREFKRNIWCFNTRNPEIKFISKPENTKTDGQQSMIQEMFCIVNENLEYHIEKAKLADELKNEKLLAEYGNMIDYILNQRFELTIKNYIDRITKIGQR